MLISVAEVQHIAQLAHLTFDEAEWVHLKKQMEQVLTYAAQLETLELEGVEPTSHGLALQNIYRESDQSEHCLHAQDIFANASECEEPFFKVPQIISGG
jgi:aspartyl-tRNA(Asn)/glutamyl-tRNA(Gln) amidotransferase subunit C